jgi:hemoglobin
MTISGDKMKYLHKIIKSLFVLTVLAVSLTTIAEETAKKPSLFDRIGGAEMAHKIVSDTWENHMKNPIIKDRFAHSDPAYVKTKVYEVFAASTGGNVKYTGKDMKTTHVGMNISDMEFNAAVDDVLAALDKNGIAQQERNEVLAILWSVRGDIVNPHLLTKNLRK